MNRDELIALARSLYNGGKGLSYGKIAEKFNADGIPTKTGKGSWEKKMVSRLIADDVLKKAEVKVGLKTDREVQLESEIESLKFEQTQMLDVISMLRKQHSIMSEMLQASKDVDTDVVAALESENAGLKTQLKEAKNDFDQMLGHLAITEKSLSIVNDVNKRNNEEFEVAINHFRSENGRLESENAELVRKNQYLTDRLADSAVNGNLKLIADLESQNEYLKSENVGLRSDRDEALKELDKVKQEFIRYRNMSAAFDAENQSLHRMLNEAELKYKTLYESEISRLGSELAVANQKIQELRDKQTFLKLESESGMPKNFMGWTTCRYGDYIRIFRKLGGKLKALYVGKEWNPDVAREKIAAFEQKQKPQSELFGTECKSCQHQPEFESRLRSVCPETVRTYRLDTVAGHFPDCAFGTEMIALAEQKRIELLAGDPSQCDVSKLISYRGRMYVNFEWR